MPPHSDRIRCGCPGVPRGQKQLGQGLRPVAFLDRDGVVNADKGYVHKIDEFEWMPGAMAAIRFLNDRRFIVAVVTNQSGIGRGYYGEEEFLKLSDWMLEEADRQGAHIDAIYYCPHHPESDDPRYREMCPARKPGTMMLERAEEEFEIDKARSFLIGNRDTDLYAADSFGISGFMYESGDLAERIRVIVEG